MNGRKSHTADASLKLKYETADGRDKARSELDWLKTRSRAGGFHRIEITFVRGRYRFKRVSGSRDE